MILLPRMCKLTFMSGGKMRYILFDLDGTLINTRDGIVYSISLALKTVGIEIKDYKLLERHIGPPIKEGFQNYYNFSDEKADEVVAIYRQFYDKLWKDNSKVYDGVKECLIHLKKKGYRLIVATSKLERIAKEFLEYFELYQYFDGIYGSNEDQSRSKKVDILQYAIASQKIQSEDTMYMVGDRCFDVYGAKYLDIPCIGVLYGFGTEQELRAAGAMECIRTPEELLHLMESIEDN